MHRFLIEINLPWELPIVGEAVRIPSYGVMLAVGAMLGLYLATRRYGQARFDRQEIVDVGVFIVLSGVVGARLFYVIENAEVYFSGGRFWHVFAIWEGGLVYYGGLILAILYIAWHFARKKDGGESLVRFWDLAAPSATLGLALTRVGCFLNGCCYGRPSDLPWAVTYPRGSHIFLDLYRPDSFVREHYYDLADKYGMFGDAARSYPVHPTQLYSAAFNLALFGFLYWYWPRRRGNGEIGGLMVICYSVFRFTVEFWRINPPVFDAIPLSVSQWVSFPMLAFGLYLFLGSRGWINPRWKALHPLSPAETGASA